MGGKNNRMSGGGGEVCTAWQEGLLREEGPCVLGQGFWVRQRRT